MPDITTADDLKLVLQEAERASEYHDATTAEQLGQAVLASGLASAHDQARASVVIAAAMLQGGSPDAAYSFLQGIDTSGDSDLAAKVRTLQTQIEHYNDQLAAGSDGVESGEVAAIIAAADEALGQGDGVRAEQLLRPAYDSAGITREQVGKVSLLLGRACLVQGRLSDAEQYAAYAASVGAAGATELEQQVKAELHAAQASADGVDPSEATEVLGQAKAAYERGDLATAASLYSSVYTSDSASGRARGRGAFNTGVALYGLGDAATARQWFEAAAAVGVDSAMVNEMLTRIDNREQALQLID